MARARTIEIRQINIAMHAPHSPQGYVTLFQKAFDTKRVMKRGKADGYLLGALYDIKDAIEKNELRGEIYRFTNIDHSAPWFNTQTGKPAEELETEQISIPNHLLPNLDRIPFIFRPKEHRFWYVGRDKKAVLGPSVAENLLQQVLDEAAREHGLPQVEVTVVPDEAAVDEVLRLHRITKLILEFKRPNADDAGDLEQEIMRRMEQRNVDRLHEEMTSKAPKGIITDAELKARAQAAAHNGFVQSQGYDAAGVSAIESTKAKPARYPQLVNTAIETVLDVLRRTSTGSKGKQRT